MTTTFEAAVEHRDAMLDVFTEITQDCLLLGLTPIGVHVNQWSAGNLSADVHFSGQDVTAVNSLAATYGDLPETFVGDNNYGRKGRVDIDGRRVEVCVYTGRPKLPAHPAGYAPQAVEVEPVRCPTCHGSGQAGQQPDGLIIECPRGCSTGGAA